MRKTRMAKWEEEEIEHEHWEVEMKIIAAQRAQEEKKTIQISKGRQWTMHQQHMGGGQYR